jgi:hypothetical protein
LAEDIPPFVVNFARAGTIVYALGGCFGPRMQQDLQLVLLHIGSIRTNDQKKRVKQQVRYERKAGRIYN